MASFSNNCFTSSCKIFWFWAFTTVSFIPKQGGISRNSSFKPSLVVEITDWSSVINFHWSTKNFGLHPPSPPKGISGNRPNTESWSVGFSPLGTKDTYRIGSRSFILVAWWIRTPERFLQAWIVAIPRPVWWSIVGISEFLVFFGAGDWWKRRFPLQEGPFVYFRHEFRQLFVFFLSIFQLLLKLFSENSLHCQWGSRSSLL